MGNCSKKCLDCQEERADSYSMVILPNQSLSSIGKFKKCPTLPTQNTEGTDSEGEETQPEHLLLAQSLYNEGHYQYAINQFMVALHHLHKSEDNFAVVHYHIAKCYLGIKRYKQAFQHCKISYDRYRENGRRTQLAFCAQLIGEIKMLQQDCILGVYYYEKALEVYEEQDEAKKIEVMYTLGIIYMETRKYEKALCLFLQLQAIILSKSYRIQKQYIYRVYLTLARIYNMKGIFQPSVLYYSKAIQVVLITSPSYSQVCRQVQQMLLRLREAMPKGEQCRLVSILEKRMPFLVRQR